MSESGAFYIVTVAGGKCLENTQGPKGVLDCLPKDSKAQHWVVETGEDTNVVAFKNCADGQYLRNNEPNKINWGKIGMGEKQWWTMEQGRTPGSCSIRSNACTSGASYLNDFQGNYQDSNYVHMWQMERNLEFWLTWYFRDANSSAFEPQEVKAPAGPSGEELESRERALAKREQQSEKLADQKTKDLEQREAALNEKQQGLADEEAAQKKREDELAAKEEKLNDIEQREADLEKRQGEILAQESEQKKPANDPTPNSKNGGAGTGKGTDANNDADKRDDPMKVLKAENEALQLKLRVQDLEKQLEWVKQPSAARRSDGNKPQADPVSGRGTSSTEANTSKPLSKQANAGASKANGIAPPTSRATQNGHTKPECDHKVYPPPRKLERKVVGYIYKGLNNTQTLSRAENGHR